MFSLENLYFVFYNNLLKPANFLDRYFLPFGSTNPDHVVSNYLSSETKLYRGNQKHECFFYDQEPLLKEHIDLLIEKDSYEHPKGFCQMLVTSEKSPYKEEACRQLGYQDLYYFFHGFAALNWYRDYRYVQTTDYQFDKVFISLNRLVIKDRSYRLTLVSEFLERNLIDKGRVSLILSDKGEGTWQDELADPYTKLSARAQEKIKTNIGSLNKSLVVDDENPAGHFSATVSPKEIALNQSALWHVVSETVFYYDKLHLTEKIFKPIVNKRPFLLVAAPGNLAYLKSYGFKTFDRWVDESYDNEQDPDIRIKLIATELEKLCSLSKDELRAMHKEMQAVLDYNYQHFFGDFKSMIVQELLDNFKQLSLDWNNKTENVKYHIPVDSVNFEEIKKTLTQ